MVEPEHERFHQKKQDLLQELNSLIAQLDKKSNELVEMPDIVGLKETIKKQKEKINELGKQLRDRDIEIRLLKDHLSKKEEEKLKRVTKKLHKSVKGFDAFEV